jgi:Cd2+/Zn2+-exporting ATPase
MLTGDNPLIAQSVASELGIDEVYGGLLPHEKVEMLERLNKSKNVKGKLAFAGDGINDAPVLSMADIGVAMGALGSDAAIEAADVVLMTDEPSKLAQAVDIAEFTCKIVTQNIIFSLGVNIIFLVLGAFGIAAMWEAVFADVGVSLLAILNSMRILRRKYKEK